MGCQSFLGGGDFLASEPPRKLHVCSTVCSRAKKQSTSFKKEFHGCQALEDLVAWLSANCLGLNHKPELRGMLCYVSTWLTPEDFTHQRRQHYALVC